MILATNQRIADFSTYNIKTGPFYKLIDRIQVCLFFCYYVFWILSVTRVIYEKYTFLLFWDASSSFDFVYFQNAL